MRPAVGVRLIGYFFMFTALIAILDQLKVPCTGDTLVAVFIGTAGAVLSLEGILHERK